MAASISMRLNQNIRVTSCRSVVCRDPISIRLKRRTGLPPAWRGVFVAKSELPAQLEADQQRKEGKPFNQRGGDDHVRADSAARFRLASDAFHRLAGQMAN